MAFIQHRKYMAAVAGAALILGGAALVPGGARAQTPEVQPAPVPMHLPFACPAPEAGAVPGVLITRAEFAAQLAKALGKTQAEVERALDQVEGELPAPEVIGTVGVVMPVADDGVLSAVAARLGVTSQELMEAMRAAAPPCPAGQPQAGAPVEVLVTPAALFESIAQKLGRGFTAAQVQAAFEASRPSGGPASVQIAFRANPEQHLEALARALGVTVEQLRAALGTIAPRVVGPRG